MPLTRLKSAGCVLLPQVIESRSRDLAAVQAAAVAVDAEGAPDAAAASAAAAAAEAGAILVSTLTLVDLAGSERVAKTGAEGIRMKEGTAINKSLLTLGNVINKLSEGAAAGGACLSLLPSWWWSKQAAGPSPALLLLLVPAPHACHVDLYCWPHPSPTTRTHTTRQHHAVSSRACAGGHIPYRDSKLTRILQPSLGGNAKTAIICNLTPAACHVEESHSTLRFACRAKRVVNNAVVNEVLSDAAVLKRQAREIEELRQALAASGG